MRRAVLAACCLVLTAAPAAAQSQWSAQLDLAGGPLYFDLYTGPTGARICNGSECAQATWRRDGDSLRVSIPDYDAVIVGVVRNDSLDGYYHNVGRLGPRTIPFRARGRPDGLLRAPQRRDIYGSWDATYTTDGRASPRIFVFSDGGEGMALAVLSNTGDYGRFTGRVEGDTLRFSHFDGSFVYMLTATLVGDTLRGTFNAGLRTQTPFTAVRSTGKRHLTPPDEMTKADTAPFRFAFRDVDGKLVTQDDPRFRGKVVIVDLFGTWCPTCHDAAAALKQLYAKYHDRGLAVVGIAYEIGGDTATDARVVRTFRDKLGLPWPLLLAGIPDAATQQATQPQLANFVAYPTTLFIGRDGRIKRVHAGFYGPATGEAHTALLADFARQVEAMLAQ